MDIDLAIVAQLVGYAVGLIVLYFIIRGAVLSALRAHTRETKTEVSQVANDHTTG